MPALAPAPVPADAELIEEVLEGRLDAYDELMKRYERLVYKTAWGFGGSHENALDLSQAVFLKVYRRLSSFEGRSDFKTWLMRIAYNEGVSWLRSNRRHVAQRQPVEDDFGRFAVAAGSAPAEQEARQLRREQRRLLLEGMSRLGQRYRTALVLRYFHGLSVREVAAALECSEGSAKNVLFRGVRNLRKQLTEA